MSVKKRRNSPEIVFTGRSLRPAQEYRGDKERFFTEYTGQLFAFLALCPYAVQVFGADGTALMINDATRRLFSIDKPERFIGRYNILREPLARRLGLAAAFKRIFAGSAALMPKLVLPGSELRREYHSGTADGIAYSSAFIPVEGPDGAVRYVVALRTDLTEQNRTENRLRAMLEGSSDMLQVVDERGNITYCSPAMKRIMGYDPAAPLGEPFWVIVHPDDRDLTRAVFADLMQKPDTPRTVTCRCVDAAGAWHHLEAGCRNLLSDPSVRGIVLNIRDITERVESQARLTESDERFRSIVEQSWEGITIIDPDGTIAMFNAAQERMSGVPASEAVGTKIWDLQSRLMTPQARAAVPPKQRIRMYRELLTTGRSPWLNKDFDSQLVRPDGAVVDLQTVLFPISTGSRTLFVAFNRDVTELRTAETALREQNRLLQEKNVALREIMAQVEEEKARIRRNIQANVDRLVMPLVSKLKGRASMTDRPLMALLEENLADVTSGFGGAVSRRMYRLTQQEVELCDMVRRGMTSKEISRLRGVSPRTVETQRNRLRRKLGIADPGVNLTTFLMHELEPHGRAPAPAGHGKGAA